MILVDCGLVFPDSDMFGVDLVIPDFTYVLEIRTASRACSLPMATKTISAACRICSKSSTCPFTLHV